MACGSCGGGRLFTPATYRAVPNEGEALTFITKTEATVYLHKHGGGSIETIPGKPRK